MAGARAVSSLDLALIGNGNLASLVDPMGTIVWTCVPRIDGDPVFCSLLQHPGRGDFGYFAIELEEFSRAEQEYVPNTPVLLTRLHDAHGAIVEITDVAPRFERFGRMFCPMTLVRSVRAVEGLPRIRIRARPACDWGRTAAERTHGSHHVRFIGGDPPLRLTTDAPITAILEEHAFILEDSVTLILGPDETVHGTTASIGREFTEETIAWWRRWVTGLAIPFEWQDAVIRAAISLKLNAVEDTGAIVAAVTTSIPEAADSGRNWDYRYCWLRDGFMVVNTLNRLGATGTMERFLRYVVNIAAGSKEGRLQPVYGITGSADLTERVVDSLPGYRGMGPVRVGNLAYEQMQHDVYGSAILAATHVFFDQRLPRRGDAELFRRLEILGEHASRLYDQPDAGLWEFRGRSGVHTYTAVMCWAGCDRLARIATQLGLTDRADCWRATADGMRSQIVERAWNPSLETFTAAFGDVELDASLLLLHEVGFVDADDPRFASTVRAVERALRRGDFIFRYTSEDGFGTPQNAFLICSFWYVNALAALGRKAEARVLFESLLRHRNRHGLLAEHVDPTTGEQWGNFVQTYSMVGLINCAVRLSMRWDQAF
jgi:GH15 family glucan-1,4-alpha-glucosidase